MAKIKLDPRNYRKHSDRNKELIAKSLKELGAGRSIVTDSAGVIIGGNGVFEQAEKQKIKTKIIETDGSELIIVKRTDIAPGSEKRRQLALADNAVGETSEFDFELLGEDFESEELESWGVIEVNGVGDINRLEEWNEDGPEFTAGEKEIKASFFFSSEKERADWCKEQGYDQKEFKVQANQWIIRI